MHAIEKCKDRVLPVGELETVRIVPAGPPGHRFGPHQAFGDRDMADEIAERQRARLVSPLAAVVRNQRGDAPGPRADALEVVEEFCSHGLVQLFKITLPDSPSQ